jgi:hypothetical protein
MKLTHEGEASLDARRFNLIVIKQTCELLEAKGFKVSQFQNLKNPSLRDGLPSAVQMYESKTPAMDLSHFRLLLSLLAECGFLKTFQSRLYFIE